MIILHWHNLNIGTYCNESFAVGFSCPFGDAGQGHAPTLQRIEYFAVTGAQPGEGILRLPKTVRRKVPFRALRRPGWPSAPYSLRMTKDAPPPPPGSAPVTAKYSIRCNPQQRIRCNRYVKIMPMKYNQVRKVILYKFHVLMIIAILNINSENKLGSIIGNSTCLLI